MSPIPPLGLPSHTCKAVDLRPETSHNASQRFVPADKQKNRPNAESQLETILSAMHRVLQGFWGNMTSGARQIAKQTNKYSVDIEKKFMGTSDGRPDASGISLNFGAKAGHRPRARPHANGVAGHFEAEDKAQPANGAQREQKLVVPGLANTFTVGGAAQDAAQGGPRGFNPNRQAAYWCL